MFSIIICLVGLLVYLLTPVPTPINPRVARVTDVGRIMFFLGLAALLLLTVLGHPFLLPHLFLN
jgi:hypothetical protein